MEFIRVFIDLQKAARDRNGLEAPRTGALTESDGEKACAKSGQYRLTIRDSLVDSL